MQMQLQSLSWVSVIKSTRPQHSILKFQMKQLHATTQRNQSISTLINICTYWHLDPTDAGKSHTVRDRFLKSHESITFLSNLVFVVKIRVQRLGEWWFNASGYIIWHVVSEQLHQWYNYLSATGTMPDYTSAAIPSVKTGAMKNRKSLRGSRAW